MTRWSFSPRGTNARKAGVTDFSLATHLQCVLCGAEHDLAYRLACEQCNGLLELQYDLQKVASIDFTQIKQPGIWCFHPILPIQDPKHIVTMGEGNTPLLTATRRGAEIGLPNLFIKYEGANPTGTFKDRSSSAAISAARQFGFERTALVTTGNAGSSVAAYCARAGLKAYVFCYSKSATAKLYHMEACATKLVVFEGGYDDVSSTLAELIPEMGIFDCDALRNPWKHEGKKTLAYELYFQLDRTAPDYIAIPVSLGEMLIATWRGFTEMREMGWIDKMPKFVICQSEASNPVVRAWEESSQIVPQEVGYTIAEGVAVGNPGQKGARVLDALADSGGLATTVGDDEIVEAMRALAHSEGIWSGPTGAITLAALARLADEGKIDPAGTIVAVVSETGLKGDFPAFPADSTKLDRETVRKVLESG